MHRRTFLVYPKRNARPAKNFYQEKALPYFQNEYFCNKRA